MVQHEKKAPRHHHTCVSNVKFALHEPHAVLCFAPGGCMHDCVWTLSTTSSPSPYLHTQSCLVSLHLKTSSSLFKTHVRAAFSQPHVWAISVDFTFLSTSLRQRGRDLRSLVYDVIFRKAKVRYACWSHIQKHCVSICRHVARHDIQL